MIDAVAVVLVGGLGTRLRSVVGDRPKPLAHVGGKPFLHVLLAQLAAQGVRRVVLATGYGATEVAESCGDGSQFGLSITYSPEPQPLGTGGAARHALDKVGSDPFLLLNGDSIVGCDFGALLRGHRGLATIALYQVPDRSRFGSVLVDGEGRITGFREKGESGPGLINAGVYVLAKAAAQQLPPGPSSIEKDLFPRLVGQGLYGAVVPGPFVDIGTPDAYAQAAAIVEAIAR